MEELYDVIVVGGGAAGMFAAIHVGLAGKRVLVLERNDRLGKKLRITGKGRCNVTNCCAVEEVLQNVPRNGRFLYSAVTQYPPARVMEFLEAEGCPLKTERGNRVFPVSDSSASVQEALERAMYRAGVTVRQGRVTEICTKEGQISGVTAGGQTYGARQVILATGGCSYPATGSTGDGYRLAARLGHTVAPPTGSLVPLEVPGDDCPAMQGLSLRNVAVRLLHEKGKCLYRDFGELLFTHFGLSGPLVLSASTYIEDIAKHRYICEFDLKPALDEKTLYDRLTRDFAEQGAHSVQGALAKLLPNSMRPVAVEKWGVDPATRAAQITKEQKQALVQLCKHWQVPVTALGDKEHAVITAGGVDVKEVDPKTMQSKLCPGLYFAGEVLDVDARTGGYNLQIAWSTAQAAVRAM